VSTLTFVIYPDPQYSDPSASLVETGENTENSEGDPDGPEPAAEGDIQMEHSSY
jgi:hypothetical protein